MKAMVIFIEKKQNISFLKNPITKNKETKNKPKCKFQLHQFKIFCPENFRDWSLGKQDTLMQMPLMWLNLYGCQAYIRQPDNHIG